MSGERRGRGRFAAVPARGLPDGLVLFDGVCVLCSGWVRFIFERDPQARFSFLPIQSEEGRVLAAALGITADEPESNAVVLGGMVHFKSDSAIAVLSALPGWRWTRWLRPVPRPVRDWLYDRVARNRYRMFGRTETCMVPGPELADRVAKGMAKGMAKSVTAGLEPDQISRR